MGEIALFREKEEEKKRTMRFVLAVSRDCWPPSGSGPPI